jgi:hypothetical protein
LPKEETLEAFILAYESEGYSKSDPPNSEFEVGFEKVAIYIDDKGVPTHAARQLSNGEWTSKLGSWEDIQHKTLDAVEDTSGLGLAYGRVAVIMKRTIRIDMQS